MKREYITNGKKAFRHGNRGNKNSRKVSSATERRIVNWFGQTGYQDMSVTHFTEHLRSDKQLDLSVETVRKILLAHNIITNHSQRKTVRAVKKNLETKFDSGVIFTPLEAATFQTVKEIDYSNAHPSCERVKYMGELIQMDASKENWFGAYKSTLHVAIDDATSTIVGAWFQPEETLRGYLYVFEQVLGQFGVPGKILTDNRTVFNYNRTHVTRKDRVSEDAPLTQFGFAAESLGVEIQTTSVPQAKGRVERVIQTLQGRLALAGIDNLDDANEFLTKFIKQFNKRFAINFSKPTTIFGKAPAKPERNLILAERSTRVVDGGNVVRYNGRSYATYNEDGERVLVQGGTRGVVIKALDNNLYFNVNDTMYRLFVLSRNAEYSPEYDYQRPRKIGVVYIPPLSHTYRQESYNRYLRQKERAIKSSTSRKR
ncbi:ISNCY family transposase [Weissella cibaria]|uniref:ISNCY family transposase n=1 Tax=Weissella cibaria TaxID=137591 RepID=UPI00143F5761|nr:ISNCY family transposase [Weissella cibaria]NKN31010.1 ISNCY family transposase [Weissella cibaria]NKN79887.1 ISNCY family transposase [Weissella cibaria]NKN98046.1 ISNCY family transposase [Weissella cibaria]NKO00186.1 ISNCY family transposase [Weissella cibaria]